MSKDKAKDRRLPVPKRPEQWVELSRREPRRAERLWQALSPQQRLRTVLAGDPVQRERLITLAKDSAWLVRSLPADEFARTLFELDGEEAATLLEHCSGEQLGYVMDLTGWVDEKFSPSRYGSWVPLILHGGAGPLDRWLRGADPEVLSLLFAHWFEVVKWLPSQEEQEPPDHLPQFTLDGVYFLRFRDEKNSTPVVQVLVHLKSEMPQRYTQVLEAMLWEPASLLASEALRWRRGRLADQGFPDKLEALELWARPRPGETDWKKLSPKLKERFFQDAPPRSDAMLELLPPGAALPALAAELEPARADALRAEAAYIANCGVVALGADPADPKAVRRAARESLGLVNLGLGILVQEETSQGGGEQVAAQILSRVSLAALARTGAQAIRELNQRAHRLMREGWLQGLPTGLHLLEPPLDRVLAGLMFPRPRFHDPSLGEGREYRSFTSLADLEQARRQLEQAEFWGELLFDLMGLRREEVAGLVVGEVWPDDPLEIKISAVVGTWLARRALGLAGLAPIPADRLNQALAALQDGLKGELARELEESCRALPDPRRARLAGELLRGVLRRLEEELARLNLQAELNPAFIYGVVSERC